MAFDRGEGQEAPPPGTELPTRETRLPSEVDVRRSHGIRNRQPPHGFPAGGALALVLLGLLGCGDSDLLGPEMSADVEEFVALANVHRASVGCGALEWLPGVAGVAQSHSEDMVARAYFAHTNPDGASPFDGLAAAGIGHRVSARRGEHRLGLPVRAGGALGMAR